MPDTQLDIRLVEQLTLEEKHQPLRLGREHLRYGASQSHLPREGFTHRHSLYHETLVPVSHAGVLRHDAHANGRRVLIGGVGGVVTVPGARRRGHAGQLLRHAAAFRRDEWKVDFALLFCIDRKGGLLPAARMGRSLVRSPPHQPDGKIPCPFHVMTLAFKPEFSRIDVLDLGSPSW